MKKIAIIYGWAEGSWQSKKLVRTLQAEGLEIADSPDHADIIFSHSLGCYRVPKNAKAELIVLVGLPYWPNKSLAMGVIQKLVMEFRGHRQNHNLAWWLLKLFYNSLYILTKPSSTMAILRARHLDNLPDGQAHKVLLVRPQADTNMQPEASLKISRSRSYKFINISGAHDDCWFKPEKYAKIVVENL